ncbi:NAD(P)H-dependent oxidoreductase [Glycomyces sp. TRM65418]|uniref:CE1759 family FMN reductase n=1 Tax=Glycomyces sp. TRM65418 TaxID=2867006 RepID=UPI001CE63870|nr:CE1759 family FMN reductase [Glycomyces sp. TRM65418]MCC3763332.1 NAD(P)H-dependent oxidoreductase [Glycomyces sp. TRM65418]QZD57329.1 NAD(P)H-dependent oxidoreductase [Glycomyces sp. TRM65418]
MNDRPREPEHTEPFRLVVVSGGTSDPSSTRMLADRIADRVRTLAADRGERVTTDVVDLRELANEITTALVSQLTGPKMTRVIELLGRADAIVAGAPVYKAAPSGLFSSFFHVLDNDLLIAKPVVLAATAGTARHALVVDDQMRSLFAYLRTMTVPTSVFAATEDWNSTELGERITRAAIEVLLLMESGFAEKVRSESWQHYQHEYGSAGGTELEIDLSTDLMRLATGGSAGPRRKQ